MKALSDNELIIVAIRSTIVVFIVFLWHRPHQSAGPFS